MQEIEVIASNISDTSKYRPKGIDKSKIAALRAANPNLSQNQIGKIVGVDGSQVCRVLREFGLTDNEVQEYKDGRPTLFQGLQRRILKWHLSEEMVKKMSSSAAALWFNSFVNNEQLLLGLPTAINMTVLYDVLGSLRGKQAPGEAP